MPSLANRSASVTLVDTGDTRLGKPAFFGVKPSLIIKGGMIAAAKMGDPNASIPTPQPVHYRPMFGAFGPAMNATCISFVSQAALAAGVPEQLGLRRRVEAVKNTRTIGKANMVHNPRHADDRSRCANLGSACRRRAAHV